MAPSARALPLVVFLVVTAAGFAVPSATRASAPVRAQHRRITTARDAARPAVLSPWPAAVPARGEGTLPPPCPSDDLLEPNDLCSNARPVSLGTTYSSLAVMSNDPDFYILSLRRSEQLTATITFSNADGNVDARLYARNPSTGCVAALLAASTSTTEDVETINYVNTGALDQFFLYVTLASGSCNGYSMSLASFGTSNLTADAAPPGWSSAIVPRNASGASSGNAQLTPTLPGNAASTWINRTMERQGLNAVGPWVGDVTLDDEPVALYSTSFPDNLGAAFPMEINRGPFTIRGGRHSLKSRADVNGEVPETSELDNAWSSQWIWSPLALSAGVPIVRARPPLPGTLDDPNSDGFSFTRATGLAWVTALAPRNPGDDYDLYVYSDYAGSTEGFTRTIGAPFFGDNYTEFVVGSASAVDPVVYPAAVLFEELGGGGDCILDQKTAAGRVLSDPSDASALGQTLAANRLADVYDVFMGAGQPVDVSLRRLTGPGRLTFQMFPSTSGGVFSAGSGAQSTALSSTIETLHYGPFGTAGYHPLVVFRERGTQAAQPVTYDLHVNASQLVGAPPPAPGGLALLGGVPNPFTGPGRVAYALPATGPVRLGVYDVRGRLVRTLEDGERAAGRHDVSWDGTDARGARLAPGVYMVRLEAAGRALARRLTLLD